MSRSSLSRAPQLLSLRSGARELRLLGLRATALSVHLEPVLRSKRSRCSDKPACRGEEWPTLAVAGGGPWAATKTQRSQINLIN